MLKNLATLVITLAIVGCTGGGSGSGSSESSDSGPSPSPSAHPPSLSVFMEQCTPGVWTGEGDSGPYDARNPNLCLDPGPVASSNATPIPDEWAPLQAQGETWVGWNKDAAQLIAGRWQWNKYTIRAGDDGSLHVTIERWSTAEGDTPDEATRESGTLSYIVTGIVSDG